MKIVVWNLKNIGATKLFNLTNANVAAAGYGNNVLSFMTNVIMGADCWLNTDPCLVPADLVLIIELKTGGANKGGVPNGTSVPTMMAIRNAMNAYAGNHGLAANYVYASTIGLIVGYHECVGVVYNTQTVTFNLHQVLRNNAGNFVLPRTPYLANFTENATGAAFNVVGIHAPPSQTGAQGFRKPISFCIQLPQCPNLMLGPGNNYFIGGDFNCQPANTVMIGGVAVAPFVNAPPPPGRTLTGYVTNLPNGTLTSVRKSVNNNFAGPARYMSGAYDNILFYPAAGAFREYTVDLVDAPNVGAGLVAKLNSYNKVSDHLPVIITPTPAPQRIVVAPLPVNPSQHAWLPVQFAASSGLVTTINVAGNAGWNNPAQAVTPNGPGLVTLTFNQAGNANFAAAAQVTRQVTFV